MTTSNDEPLPLGGLRVLELGATVASAMAGRVLADYGAEVVKVEDPRRGDPARAEGPFPGDDPQPNTSGLFVFANLRKRSIALAIGEPRGAELLRRLIPRFDVVIEDQGVDALGRIDATYDHFASAPRLIWASLTAFGDEGPYTHFKVDDLVLAAMSGWMFQTGSSDGPPLRTGGALVDTSVPGLFLASGILAALEWRERSGRGQRLSVSAFEALLHFTRYYETTYHYSGHVVRRGTNSPTYQIYPCADGYVALAVITDPQWELLCHFLGLSEWLEDQRIATNMDRLAHATEIYAEIARRLSGRSKAELFHEMQVWRLPVGLVADASDILELEQHRVREYLSTVEQPGAGALTLPGRAIRLDGAAVPALTPAPALGEHTRATLSTELDLGAGIQDALLADGVIFAPV